MLHQTVTYVARVWRHFLRHTIPTAVSTFLSPLTGCCWPLRHYSTQPVRHSPSSALPGTTRCFVLGRDLLFRRWGSCMDARCILVIRPSWPVVSTAAVVLKARPRHVRPELLLIDSPHPWTYMDSIWKDSETSVILEFTYGQTYRRVALKPAWKYWSICHIYFIWKRLL